jgi:GTP-binding protein
MPSKPTDHPSPPTAKRIVAIVGRPNVGKSALFNRLAGKRVAIVHEQSGVTRDRLVREVAWDDDRFELIDTGGIGNMDGEGIKATIDAGTRQQVDIALEDAPIVIFVVDLHAGILPLDEEVAGILREGGAKVYLAANKADTPNRDTDAAEFERFGFPVFPVSALHNRGIGDMMDEVAKQLPKGTNETIDRPLKVAVVGRPNVGKSSYINRLLRNDRVIVSDIPGTTRDSIEVPFSVGAGAQAQHYTLIDTAGIRRRGKVGDAVEIFSLIRAEESIKKCDLAVLVVDATKGVTSQDKKIAAKVLGNNKGCVVLVNKWDLSEVTQTKFFPELAYALAGFDYIPIVFASAESGYNIRNTVDAIDYVATQIRADLPTGVLNRTILAAHQKTPPAAVNGKRLKIYYSTQTGHQPIRVTLFVNNPKIIQDSYKSYLTKAIRKAFGLEGAPIVIRARGRGPRSDKRPAPRRKTTRRTTTTPHKKGGKSARPGRSGGQDSGKRRKR